MSAHIVQSLDAQQDLTTVTVIGDVTVQQVTQQVVSFLTGRVTQRVLWDITQGSLLKLSADGMRRIVREGSPHAHKRLGGRTAILTSKAVDYGLARMFEALASVYHIPFAIHPFLDRAEAMAWLLAPNDVP